MADGIDLYARELAKAALKNGGGGGGDSVFTLSEDTETDVATITPNTDLFSVNISGKDEQSITLSGNTVNLVTSRIEEDYGETIDESSSVNLFTNSALMEVIKTTTNDEFMTDTDSKIRVSDGGSSLTYNLSQGNPQTGDYAQAFMEIGLTPNGGGGIYAEARNTFMPSDDDGFESSVAVTIVPPIPDRTATILLEKTDSSDSTNNTSVLVTGVATPQADYDAANKKYVDEHGGGGGGAFSLSEDEETATAIITPNTESEGVTIRGQEQDLYLEGRTVSMYTYSEDSEYGVTSDNYVSAGDMNAYIETCVNRPEGNIDACITTGQDGSQLVSEFYSDEFTSDSSVTAGAYEVVMRADANTSELEGEPALSVANEVFASIQDGTGLTNYTRIDEGDNYTLTNTSGIYVTPFFNEEEPSVIQLKSETWVSDGGYVGDGSIRVTGVATPIDDNDAVNKKYVDEINGSGMLVVTVNNASGGGYNVDKTYNEIAERFPSVTLIDQYGEVYHSKYGGNGSYTFSSIAFYDNSIMQTVFAVNQNDSVSKTVNQYPPK